MSALLRVHNLRVQFQTIDGTVRAVDGVSFALERGRALGVVGETGCGKSVTALSVARLLPPSGKVMAGEVWFDGRDLLTLSETEMAGIRGRRISFIFQEPAVSLNPVLTIGEQLVDIIGRHRGAERPWEAALDALRMVRMPDPTRQARQYPHELSGGMQQRALIAMALCCGPDLLIADEPTTALDVTTAAEIIRLLRELRQEVGMSLLFISHDLGTISELCDDIAVMYAGQIVEHGPTRDFFKRPMHPYGQGLLQCLPSQNANQTRLPSIPGTLPDPTALPAGCRFHPRCPFVMPHCSRKVPQPVPVAPSRQVSCFLYDARVDEPDGVGS